MSSLNRRSFLKSSAATVGATFAISGTKSSGRILGANDRINVVVAGFHGRGQGHIADYLAADTTEIA